MLKEQRPFKFFKVPVSYMKEFAREAKEHGLLYVPIRNRQKSDRIEVVVFADDASKIQRIYDNLGLDYVAAQAGDATVEKAPVQEKQPPAAAAPSRTETVQTEHGVVEFEVGGFEDEIELSSVPDREDGANFTPGREKDPVQGEAARSPSENSSPDRSSSPGPTGNEPAPEQKPSVRKQLQEIRQEQQPQQETPRLSKEEYAAMRKAEREELQARVDAQAQEVFRDDASMKGFLNFMAQCTPQSTRNLLILYEQDPTITHPRTFDKWKEAGRSLRSGVTGYAFYADQEYEREDGTKGSGFTITKAFDISQTRGQQPLPSQQRLPEEIIAALVEQSPVPLAISDQLPQGVQAQYVPKQRTIYVRNGMDETATICAIAREQAHAGFDTVGSGYYRQAYAPQAYCAAYVVAQKLGLNTSAFHFDKVCQTCAGMEVQEKKGFISDVKRAAYAINRDMQRSFREMEQTIQPDEFSVEPPKPAKAPKAKEDKEKEAAR